MEIAVKENEARNCDDHFIMRGYVAKMREKNWNACDPFAKGPSQYELEQLPPMIVPRHRFWRCEVGGVCRSGQSGLKSDGPCLREPPCSEAAVPPPEMQQSAAMELSSQVNIHLDASSPRINAELCASLSSDGKDISTDTREVAVTGSDVRASSSSHGKGKSSEIRDMASSGDERESGDVNNQENDGEPHHKSSSPRGEQIDCAVSSQLNSYELVHPMDQDISGPDAHEIRPPAEFYKSVDENTDEMFLSQKKNIAEDERGVSADKPVGVGSVHLTTAPPIQVIELDSSSSDSERTLDGCSDLRHHYDEANSLPRRRTRKVRLLTDLLSGKDSSENGRIRKGNTSYNSMAATSKGLGSVVAREAPAPHEDLGKGKQCPPRKRKMSHLEESRSLETRGLAKVSKKMRSARISSERPHKASGVPNSGSEESHRSKHKNEVSPSSFNNKTLVQVGSDSVGIDIAVGALERSDAVMGRSYVASTTCTRTEAEKSLNLNKGKRPVVENGNTSPDVYSNLRKAPTQPNQTESMPSVPTQSEIDAPTNVCLDLSLGRPPISAGVAKSNIHKAKPIQQKDSRGGFPTVKNKCDLGHSSMLNNPSPTVPVRKGVTWDLHGRIEQRLGIALGKQNSSALSEKRGFTLQEKVDAYGKNKEVQGLVEASRRQNDRRASMAFEKGYSDDIPMEIVELMAKNQYERQMAEREGYSLSKRTDCTNRHSVSVNQHHPIKWLHTQTPSTPNTPNANATNGIAAAFGNRIGTSGNAIFSGTVSENRQKPSNGVQYPVYRSGSRPSERVTPAWLSKNENLPFGLGVPQKTTTLSDNIESHARSAEVQHTGRTISDIKQHERQVTLSKPGEGELHPNPRGSLNPYANASISAMHLLSLMDKGMASNASFNADANRFVEVPSSRCEYHPGFSSDARRNVLDRSFSLQQHKGPAIYFAAESSHRPSSSFSVATGYTGQMSFRSPNFDESRKWTSPVPLGVGKSQKALPRSGGIIISQHPSSQQGKQNRGIEMGILGASNSLMILPQRDRLEYPPRFIDLQANNVSGTLTSEETLEDNDCQFNQNPADFSIPEPGNAFTINGRDLKLLEHDIDQERSYTVDVDSRKRQRATKVSTGKKHDAPEHRKLT